MEKDAILMLGAFEFRVSTATFAELSRTAEWSHPEQARIGNDPAIQFTGYSAPKITLPIIIYPGASGDARAAQSLYDMAESGGRYRLVDATGTNFGLWVIESIADKSSAFTPDGIPRKITLDLALKRASR
jgi:phage protein U